jgi:AcrR family transcriptional regulator
MALKDDILKAALELAARNGIAATGRDDIAARVPCAGGSVSYHLGDAKHLRRAIVEAAIERRNLRVVGFAIGERHPSVQGDKIDATLRADALRVHLAK